MAAEIADIFTDPLTTGVYLWGSLAMLAILAAAAAAMAGGRRVGTSAVRRVAGWAAKG